MKTLKQQFTFRPFATMLVLAFFMFFMNSMQIQAQSDSGSGSNNAVPQPFQNQTTGDNSCVVEMQKYAAAELKDYRDFLETNFQNKSSTGSLLDNAIGKYRDLRKALYTAYARYFPNQGSIQITTGLQPSGCLQIITDTLTDAQYQLKIHAVRTSGVKKSTALLEKYQSINSKLTELNRQFVNMKALLDSFDAKLPCYIKSGSCVKG